MATILMTALVPTLGHKALIDFAIQYVKTVKFLTKQKEDVVVIVSGRSFEPISLGKRIAALEDHYYGDALICGHMDDNAPQNPSTLEEWQYWKDVIKRFGGTSPIIGSEPYCKKVASLFDDWEYVPFDEPRGILDVKGTRVRNGRIYNQLLPEIKYLFQKKYTIFGQESVGKTTFLNDLNEYAFDPYCASFLQEYARPYLEYKDSPKITDELMNNIFMGQYALQRTAYHQGNPYIIQDTDLLSTIGYWLMWNPEIEHSVVFPKLVNMFRETKSDMYFLISPEGVPFEPDPLRYGGDKRETEMSYWEDLLKKFNCKYYIIEGDRRKRVDQFVDIIYKEMQDDLWSKLQKFVRE